MTTKAPSRRPAEPHLDNLTLSRKEGWKACTEVSPSGSLPRLLTKGQIRRLSEAAADIYKQRREDWHNNLGPLKTPQLAALHEDLWDILDSNAQDGDHARARSHSTGYQDSESPRP